MEPHNNHYALPLPPETPTMPSKRDKEIERINHAIRLLQDIRDLVEQKKAVEDHPLLHHELTLRCRQQYITIQVTSAMVINQINDKIAIKDGALEELGVNLGITR